MFCVRLCVDIKPKNLKNLKTFLKNLRFLPALPIMYSVRQTRWDISEEQHRPCIYSSRTASLLYISAEEHRPRSGDPCGWRPQTDEKYGQVNPHTSEPSDK